MGMPNFSEAAGFNSRGSGLGGCIGTLLGLKRPILKEIVWVILQASNVLSCGHCDDSCKAPTKKVHP